MRITPLDVRKQEFRRAVRGLDADEVHAFLATVADEYEAVLTDNKQLRDKVVELDEKVAEYRNMEKTLRDTLLTAERVMTEARQNARKEAEVILREAQVKAHQATADLQNRVDALRGQMRELRGQRDAFLARLQSLAESQIGLATSYRQDFKADDERTERLMRDPEGPSLHSASSDPTSSIGGESQPASAGSAAGSADSWRDYQVAGPASAPRGGIEAGEPVAATPLPAEPIDTRVDLGHDVHEDAAIDEVTDAVDSLLVPPADGEVDEESSLRTTATVAASEPGALPAAGSVAAAAKQDEGSSRWSLNRFTKGLASS